MNATQTERPDWTICYRKRTANRFFRVTNWSGTWSQALAMARLFAEANPDLQVYYTSSAEAENAGRVVAEDIANILIEDSNKRIRIVEKGELPQSMIARIPADVVARQRWIAGEPIADPELTEDEAQAEALAICSDIPVDGRPADVTEQLVAAELVTDAHENLVLVRRAHARFVELAQGGLQLVVWMARHGLTGRESLTAEVVLAARDDDHDEALAVQRSRAALRTALAKVGR